MQCEKRIHPVAAGGAFHHTNHAESSNSCQTVTEDVVKDCGRAMIIAGTLVWSSRINFEVSKSKQNVAGMRDSRVSKQPPYADLRQGSEVDEEHRGQRHHRENQGPWAAEA